MSALTDYAGETYYGQPAVKPAPFEWTSAVYLAVSALAGGAQLVATVVRWFGTPRLQPVVRNGRDLALVGAVVGPLLLITDLKTPRRWYNMMRIFRRTSPMSLGSYLLTGFGVSSVLAAWNERTARRNPHARDRRVYGVDLPASLSAAGLTTYTAALLASTSTPLWSAAPRLLGARFATSAVAAGAAALSLAEAGAGRYKNCATLDFVAALATAADLTVSFACERAYARAGVATPLHQGTAGTANQAAIVLGGALPLACYAFAALRRRPPPTLSVIAALGILAGGLLMRVAYHEGGKASARRPRDYFGTTQLPPAVAPSAPDRSRAEQSSPLVEEMS